MILIDFILKNVRAPVPAWVAIVAYLVGCALGVLAEKDHQKQKNTREQANLFSNYLAEHPDMCPYLGSKECQDFGDMTKEKCHNKQKHKECGAFKDIQAEIDEQ